MLQQETHKRLYRWHSVGAYWISVLLIMLAVTAVPVVFITELQEYVFATAAEQQPDTTLSNDELAALTVEQLNLQDGEFLIERLGANNYPVLWWWNEAEHKYQGFIVNAEQRWQEIAEINAITVIALAHYEFLLPDPYGEYFVGFIGLFTLILVVIGVLLHVKWRKEKTQFRKNRSFRLWSSDLHKLLGFWLLPYYILVTYTGTILGLGGLLLIMSAMSTFQGDQEAAIAAVIGEEPIYAGSSCEMKSIDDFLVKSEQHWQAKYGASQLLSYDIHYYRDCNAVLGVHSEIPGYLATTNTLSYSLVTGELLREKDWIAGSVGDRWYALLAPLHFGHFAGYLGRWFYAVSAVALVALIISGLLLWVDKQQSEPSNNKFSYFYSHPLLKLSLAVVLSISATTYLMLLIAKITPALFTVFSPTLFYIASFLSLTALTYLLPKQLKLYLAMLALLSLTLMFSDVVNSANSAWLNGVNISLLGFAAFFVLALVKVKRLETA